MDAAPLLPGGDDPHAHGADDLIPLAAEEDPIAINVDDLLGEFDDYDDLDDEDSTDSDSSTDSSDSSTDSNSSTDSSDSSTDSEGENYSHDWKLAGEVTCLLCGHKFTCKKFKLMVMHYNRRHKGLKKNKKNFECPKCAQILASSFKDVHHCRIPKTYKNRDQKKKNQNQKRGIQKKKNKRSN